MSLRCLFLLVCLFSAHLSLSQESGKANPRIPVTEPPKVVSKGGIVYVVGDVHKATGVVMGDTGPTTVLKVLAMAKGVKPTASLHKAKIIRKGEHGPTEVPVDIKEILAGKAPDVTLQADDILFVPRSASKSSMQKIEIYYDVAPSAPMQDAAPIYIR